MAVHGEGRAVTRVRPKPHPKADKPAENTPENIPGLTAGNAQWLDGVAADLLRRRATERSLGYSLEFYRVIADAAGIDGSKPELVAKWLLDRLRGDDDGREPHPVG